MERAQRTTLSVTLKLCSLSFCKCQVYIALDKKKNINNATTVLNMLFLDSLFSICIMIHVPTVCLMVL